jgi:hypothetical protein
MVARSMVSGTHRPSLGWRSRLEKHLRIDCRQEVDHGLVESLLVGKHGDIVRLTRASSYVKWKLTESWGPQEVVPSTIRAVLISAADEIKRRDAARLGTIVIFTA